MDTTNKQKILQEKIRLANINCIIWNELLKYDNYIFSDIAPNVEITEMFIMENNNSDNYNGEEKFRKTLSRLVLKVNIGDNRIILTFENLSNCKITYIINNQIMDIVKLSKQQENPSLEFTHFSKLACFQTDIIQKAGRKKFDTENYYCTMCQIFSICFYAVCKHCMIY